MTNTDDEQVPVTEPVDPDQPDPESDPIDHPVLLHDLQTVEPDPCGDGWRWK